MPNILSIFATFLYINQYFNFENWGMFFTDNFQKNEVIGYFPITHLIKYIYETRKGGMILRAHEKPRFDYDVDVDLERRRIRSHQRHREIPTRNDDNLILATWNLTNFGLQKREDEHLDIMAEIIKPFDIIAVQEVADNLTDLDYILERLGTQWDAIFTDIAGNYERLGYIYKKSRVKLTGLAAELALRAYERVKIVIEGEENGPFEGFNRNPYMLGCRAGDFEFNLVNVHLYWTSFYIRQLETEALSSWAKKRVKKDFPPNNDIILIGDFNMPKLHTTDKIYKLLTGNGLTIPKYNTELIGTNLAGDKHYDEVAFFPSRTNEDFTDRIGVFDFDKVLFEDLYGEPEDDHTNFFKYVRYYIADHRPLWVEFNR